MTKKILVVDDELEVCSALSKFLKHKGYDVNMANNGTSALERIREWKPDIVLLDIIMPGMSGIDVLEHLKGFDPSPAVVMTTAMTDEELAKKTLELGAYDYITKPFNLSYLDTVVLVKMAELLK
jgi:DNA-binding response OmpR family regulator